jgi:hypothetical protein
MIKIVYVPADRTLAERIVSDLRGAGYPLGGTDTAEATKTGLLIVVLSPQAATDTVTQSALVAALDQSQHIVPVLAGQTEIPKLIDHLNVVDFSANYDFARLRTQVDAALSPDAPLPLRVRTPTVKRSNRSIGIVLGGLVLFWFVAGLYAVGVLHIQAPKDEYSAVDTEAALTQAFYINPELDRYGLLLPRSTEQAQNYDPTLRMVPTVYRPFMAATATAYSLGTPLATNVLRTPTPDPED